MTRSKQKLSNPETAAKAINPDARRGLDTFYNKVFPCWVVQETDTSALVVYDDDPSTVVATGNYFGRFTAN